MAKPRKPRGKAEAAPAPNPVAEFFRLPEPPKQESFNEEPSQETSKPDPMVELLRRFDALEEKSRSREAEIDNLRRSMLQAPAQPQYQEPVVRAQQPVTEAPDPLTDPKGFAAHVRAEAAREAQAATAAERAALERDRQHSQRVGTLWEDFSAKYEDLAEHTDMVEFAADKVIKQAIARGMDPNKYMFSPDGIFLDDVAKEVKKLMPDVDDEDEGDDPPTAGRTGGLFGGQESGYKPASGQPQKAPSFEAQLKEVQRKSGFFALALALLAPYAFRTFGA